MPLEELVLEKLRRLPPEQQEEVLHFVEFLVQKESATARRKSIAGVWADLGITITEDDIDEARREMWGQFPREMAE